jgi:hypothetical protein
MRVATRTALRTFGSLLRSRTMPDAYPITVMATSNDSSRQSQ